MGIARTLLTGLGIGAGGMYLFDPRQGKRRRSLIRDQCVRLINDAGCWFDKALRDTQHRIEGTIAEAHGMFDHGIPSDQKLTERVRSRLGRIAAHPRLIEVSAHDGRVTLTGHAPADEIGPIAACAAAVRGVRSVDNLLDDHLGPDVAQNGHMRRRPSEAKRDLMRDNWAPATRLAAGTLGGMLMLNCLARRTPGAMLLGTLGAGVFARAMANRALGEMIEQAAQMAQPTIQRAGSSPFASMSH